jgi:hypothetical protein
VAYACLATGIELGQAQRESTELMEIRLVPVEEALRMARDKRGVAIEGEISGPSALVPLWCQPFLPQ